ncbi:MAG TPA: hypothetical protein VEO54_11910 [Thermoanaerobaculia bacterium]|nr:hypothetical protein [Thermoanaerobaculia bacterium]
MECLIEHNEVTNAVASAPKHEAIGGVVQPVVPEYEEVEHPRKAAVAKAKYMLERVQLSRREEGSGARIAVAQSPKSGTLATSSVRGCPSPRCRDANTPKLGKIN